jgi:hypothetical protein
MPVLYLGNKHFMSRKICYFCCHWKPRSAIPVTSKKPGNGEKQMVRKFRKVASGT